MGPEWGKPPLTTKRQNWCFPSRRPLGQSFQSQTIDHREQLFGDDRPFAQCHASTIVSSADEGLLVAWFAGTREGHSDTGIWCARRSARARAEVASQNSQAKKNAKSTPWSRPRMIAKVSNEAHWNPVLFALSPNRMDLMLHFKVGARIRSWQTWAQRSNDGGITWSKATPLVSEPHAGRGGRGPVKNKPIRLAGGDWIAGASIEGWRKWSSFMDRSPDGVSSWTAGDEIRLERRRHSGKGLIQPTLWESSPSVVHALFRSTNGRIHRSDSADDGRTWSTAYPIEVPNNNSGLDLVRMSDGRLALACNPVAGNRAARSPLSLLLSTDNGHSWPERIDLETEAGEFSYPSIIETDSGLAVSYTWNRRRIAVATIA